MLLCFRAWQDGHGKIQYGRRPGSFVLFHSQDLHESVPIQKGVDAKYIKATFFFSVPQKPKEVIVSPHLMSCCGTLRM